MYAEEELAAAEHEHRMQQGPSEPEKRTLAGVVLGMPDEEYHAHPSLSSTGVRRLLDSPARFRWALTHPEPPKKEFDLGHAVHAKVLGVGAGVVEIPGHLLSEDGGVRSAAAKLWVSEARGKGLVPLKRPVLEQVDAMAEALLAHNTARLLLEQDGSAEASVFAQDPEFGFGMRARFDFLPDAGTGPRSAFDLKTTARDASPAAFAKAAADHGYETQQVWYELVHTWAEGWAPPMVFVVVEVAPPHLVAVHQLDAEFVEIGRTRVERARALYADCLARDQWPGYEDRVFLTPPPMWLIYRNTDEENELSEVEF